MPGADPAPTGAWDSCAFSSLDQAVGGTEDLVKPCSSTQQPELDGAAGIKGKTAASAHGCPTSGPARRRRAARAGCGTGAATAGQLQTCRSLGSRDTAAHSRPEAFFYQGYRAVELEVTSNLPRLRGSM